MFIYFIYVVLFLFAFFCCYLCSCMCCLVGTGSSVGMSTDHGLDVPGSNPSEDEVFHPFRPAMEQTKPPVK